MPRRLSLLVAALAVCVAVVVVSWLQHRSHAHRPGAELSRVVRSQVGGAPVVSQGYSELPPEAVDPAEAVATILDVRAQFGSVLTGSDLDAVAISGDPIDPAGSPQSFDDFLRATAGVAPPPATETVPEPNRLGQPSPQGSSALAQAMRQTAVLLDQQARQAQEKGDLAQHQRYSGLAMLLAAEADTLAEVGRADR